MQHATPHSSSPTTTSKFPLAFSVPRFKTKQTQLNELERHVPGRVTAPANVRELFQPLRQERVVILARVIHNLVQSMPERLSSYWFSRKTRPLLMCMPLSCKIRVTQLLNWREACYNHEPWPVINLDMTQLQNEIWWAWFVVEFSNDYSKTNQANKAFSVYLITYILKKKTNKNAAGLKKKAVAVCFEAV